MQILTLVLLLGVSSAATIAVSPETSPNSLSAPNILKRGGCAGGVNVCCGSSSVGCGGNVCKACCGHTCGCFYVRGSSCNSQTTPCVDVNNPDFALSSDGDCHAPSTGRGGGGGGSGGGNGGGSSGGSSFCQLLKKFGFVKHCP